MVYDSGGRRTAVVNPLNQRASSTATRRTLMAARPTVDQDTGDRTSFSYDAASNVVAQTNPLGNRTTFLYDLGSRPRAHRQSPLVIGPPSALMGWPARSP